MNMHLLLPGFEKKESTKQRIEKVFNLWLSHFQSTTALSKDTWKSEALTLINKVIIYQFNSPLRIYKLKCIDISKLQSLISSKLNTSANNFIVTPFAVVMSK